MFGRNTYQIPQVSHSSLHSRDSASVIDFNEAELFHHHHHHHHLLSGSYLAGNAPVNEAGHDSRGGGISGDRNSCPTKHAVKKDRHSKIYTSQGPRDRRVRLSIGIARKFFDLQEMLGVDKPSKTLDWLLTKSKTAIKDLVHTKQNTDKNDVSSTTENNEETLENGKSVGKRKSAGKQKGGGGGGGKDPQVSLAKESRAKARARARERTREKMCIKQQQEQQLQQCMNNQLEICKISGIANNNNNGFCLSAYEEAVNHQEMIQESIVIKRKVKNPSSVFGFQQNLIISKDLTSSNSGIPSSFPTSENWDVSSFNSQANIYAIWDQHRFVNSSSNN